MILNPKATHFAYRCPECGTFAVSLVGSLALTAEKIELRCPCGGSEATIRYTPDRKVALTVPCFTCPRPHTFRTSRDLFFSGELLAFPCQYSGLDVCFAGTKEQIDEAIPRADEALRDLMGDDEDFSVFSSVRGEDVEPQSPEALDSVLFTLNELLQDGSILCNCPDRHGDYELELHGDKVTVLCKNCRAKADIRSDSVIAAEDFSDVRELILH